MSESEHPLIILVEDNPSIAKLIEFKLSREPFRLEHYANGIEGWEAIRDKSPDLVVLDVMLPGMNGFDILYKMRDNENTKGTKVMMLTSKSREEDIQRGFDHEVVEYMSKPFKIGEFMLRVNRIMKVKG